MFYEIHIYNGIVRACCKRRKIAIHVLISSIENARSCIAKEECNWKRAAEEVRVEGEGVLVTKGLARV